MKEDIEKFLSEKRDFIDSKIIENLPRKFDAKQLEEVFGKVRHEYDLDAINEAIADPIHDILDRGGKRWRPALFLLITEILGGDVNKVQDFVIVPEFAHEGSLIVDDIEDSGELRRGKPCIHKIFGIDVGLNAGNMMYFFPLLVFMKNKDNFDHKTLIRAYEIYSQEMINIHLGQGTDIYWHRGKKDDISEEQYLQMCAFKTGTLARMAARLAVALSGGSTEEEHKIGRMAETIGIAFQIQDDILSASGEEFTKKKGFGDDITEGKRTLIVIHTLKNSSPDDRKRLLDILNRHTKEPALISEAIGILKKYQSVDYARERARRLVTEAWEEADSILPDCDAKNKLKAFVDYLVEREI